MLRSVSRDEEDRYRLISFRDRKDGIFPPQGKFSKLASTACSYNVFEKAINFLSVIHKTRISFKNHYFIAALYTWIKV